MNLRSPWVVVPLAVTVGLVLYLGLAWGGPGMSGLLLFLFLAVALGGPLFAAVHLGGQAVASPIFRRRLLHLLAFPAGAGLIMGWMAGGHGDLFFALVLVFMGMALVSACAFVASVAHRPGVPGREGLAEVARSLWTLVLAGVVFCCVSLPTAVAVDSYELGRAKSWVESAAAEVRSVERSTGRIPAELTEILPRIGPAPRKCPSADGGYRAWPEKGSFQFSFPESGGLMFSYWIYDGRSGEWTYVAD